MTNAYNLDGILITCVLPLVNGVLGIGLKIWLSAAHVLVIQRNVLLQLRLMPMLNKRPKKSPKVCHGMNYKKLTMLDAREGLCAIFYL